MVTIQIIIIITSYYIRWTMSGDGVKRNGYTVVHRVAVCTTMEAKELILTFASGVFGLFPE